jgi:transmembrane sensor
MTQRATLIEQAAAWHVLLSSGTPTEDDMLRLELWLEEPKHRAAYEHVTQTWDLFENAPRPATPPTFLSPGDDCRPSRSVGQTWRAAGYAIAASVALLVAVTGILTADIPTRLVADAMTSVGDTRKVRLDDGSIVTLNTASALEVLYTAGERRIRLLKGEALMDVVPDPGRPFIVEAEGGTTRALGTIWSVAIDASGVTATVLQGRVAVHAQGAGESVTLSVGQRIRYTREGIGATEQVDAEVETAWSRGKLIFVDKPLGDVVAELNRYHQGRIEIADPRLRHRIVSGVFDLRDPVGALNSIEQSLGVRSVRLTDLLILLYG